MYTLASLRTELTARVALANATAQVQNWQDAAIREMVDSADWRIVDVTFADLTVNGTVQRWMVPGDNIVVLPSNQQIAPDGLAAPPFYVAYQGVSWRQRAPDDVTVEQGTAVNGSPLLSQTVGNLILGGGTVAATAPPTLPTSPPGATSLNTFLRLWYQRKVPQPDFTQPTASIRCDMQFARIATLGYYLGILADNQAGGDIRAWRKKADEYLQQAGLIQMRAIPAAFPAGTRADGWLLGV